MIEGDLTPRQKAHRFRKLKTLRGQGQYKYYIKFKRKGDWYRSRRDKFGGTIWPRAVWPILFNTREEAELAISCLPIFLNAGKRGDSRRFVSASIERTKVAA